MLRFRKCGYGCSYCNAFPGGKHVSGKEVRLRIAHCWFKPKNSSGFVVGPAGPRESAEREEVMQSVIQAGRSIGVNAEEHEQLIRIVTHALDENLVGKNGLWIEYGALQLLDYLLERVERREPTKDKPDYYSQAPAQSGGSGGTSRESEL